ncbi:MAG: hypothetical protein RBS78_00035 [Coriobacteriia bacterium]|nr:hypothetical protein [Coriobacteriia bacterium]
MEPIAKRTVVSVVSAVVATALIVGLAVWVVMNGQLIRVKTQAEQDAARIETLESEVQSLTVALSAKVEEPAAEDGRFFCFITQARWSGSRPELTVDYAQLLTGAQAAAAAAAAGEESPPPNDYFIVNTNPRLRTFPADSAMRVRMTSSAEGSVPDGYSMTFGEWFDAYSGMSGTFPTISKVPYWITIRTGTITAIEEQYLP